MVLKKPRSVGKKLNKKDLLSTNLATKHGYCTQLVDTRHKMQYLDYNDKYPNGLILDVIFKFKGLDWLITDANKITYQLCHFENKRSRPFRTVHWSYNNGSVGIWHNRKFITKKELREKSYRVNEKIIIYHKISILPW
jgi:hypothetical protein